MVLGPGEDSGSGRGPAPAPGDAIAERFVIESVAGSGGMGTVFRAYDRNTGQTVALKLCDASGSRAARFTREIQILSRLSDPGIVSYIASGWTAHGQPFLVMEWLEGEDLSRRLRRATLTAPQSLLLLRKITEALAAAHRLGIVHRDLKPSNVFLRGGAVERATLLDFGIARWAWGRRSGAMTATGAVIGTPQYMAPEQARGDADVGPAADVFSLGCMLFECLAGRPPFVSAHVAAILAKIVFDDAPRLSSALLDVPEPLDALVARMLEKDPARRPPDAAALLAELDALPPIASRAEARTLTRAPPPSRPEPSEQQILSVILARPPTTSAADTPDPAEAGLRAQALRSLLAPYDCRVEALADGALAVVLAQTGRTAATDRAVQAARSALLIRDSLPGARIALATGRGLLRETSLSAGNALDRAASLLEAPPQQQRTEGEGEREAGAESGAPVWVDEVTARLIDASFALDPAGAGRHLLRHERGLLDPSRRLLGKPTPCVGREQELTTLTAVLESCVEEPCARAVVVRAPPGVGKSRLRHEFLRRAAAQRPELVVLIGRGDAMSAGSSYGLLGQALRQLAGVAEGAPIDEQQRRLRARVSERVPAASVPRVAAFLGEMCGVPFPDEHLVELRKARQDAGLIAEQIDDAFVAFLRAECGARPVLLVLEDLHWGDRATVRLCDLALKALPELPLMILALARPEIDALFPRMWEERSRCDVQLAGLGRRACERLARGVLGAEVPDSLVDRIVAQSAGNALFLEELIRAAAEGEGDELPESVLAMLHARLMRLAPGARRVLRAASVFGETFWLGGVRALLSPGAPAPVDDVAALVAMLVEAETIEPRRESRLAGDREYAFRHGLVRDAAYSMLSEQDRAAAHRLAGPFLEAAGERDPRILAEHYERGGDLARAGHHHARAVEQAMRGTDAESAIAHGRRGLACGVEGSTRTTLLSQVAMAYCWRHESWSAAPYADEVLRLAAPGSAPWSLALVARHSAAQFLGQHERADEAGRLLLEAEPLDGAIDTYSFAMSTRAYMVFLAARWDQVRLFGSRARAIAASLDDRSPAARAWMELILAFIDAFDGEDPWMALQRSEAARRSFREMGHRRDELLAQFWVGMDLWLLGAFAGAVEALRETFLVGAQFGPVTIQRTAYLVEVLLDQGDGALDEAHRIAEDFRRSYEHSPAGYDAGTARWVLADVLLRRGALAEAEREARAACDLLQAVPLHLGPARVTLAATLLAQGRAPEALRAAEEALSLYESRRLFGMKGERARLVHADCLAAAGDPARARAALEAARAHLLAKADRIPDPPARRRFLEDVPENARILRLTGGPA